MDKKFTEGNARNIAKAFTLVELAIVLVVIGIIAAMAIGGTDVLASAQVRSEINKLAKFEAALSTYTANNNKFPKYLGNDTTSHRLETRSLIGLGIEEKDLKSKFARNTKDKSAYQLQYCAPDPNDTGGTGFFVLDGDEASNLCLNVGLGVKLTDNSSDTNLMHNAVFCYAELLMDDENHLTGSVRTHNGADHVTLDDNWSEIENYNCDNVTDGYGQFGYKIF
jgi:prepilin-type N-terminal cleavage/methylation domain-containing protein